MVTTVVSSESAFLKELTAVSDYVAEHCSGSSIECLLKEEAGNSEDETNYMELSVFLQTRQ